MKDLGLSLSTGINSFAKGMELGERMKARMDDNAWNAELKNRQRAEWQASDELRAKQTQAQQLQAYYEAMQSGIDIDPAPVLDAMRNAGPFGASVAQHFAEPEKMQGWIQAAQQALESGQGSPQALEALNWRLKDQVNRGIGTVLERPMILDDAHVVPAGSKILGKRISRVLPAARRNGNGKWIQNGDASLFFGLDVDVETPDGRRMTYPAPITSGRGTADDEHILEVPFESILDLVEADRLVMSDVQRDPKFAGALRAVILASNGKVPADQKTNSIREYQFAQRGGFKGSFEDWVAKGGSGGLTATQREAAAYAQDPNFRAYVDRPQRMPAYLNTGGAYVDPAGTRPPIDKTLPPEKMPNALSDAERAKAEGRAQGEAAAELPGAQQKAKDAIHVIDLLINHPGRSTITGKSGALGLASRVPGTDAADANAILKQLQGQAFLEAFESLRGGGHITEVEGQKATEAMARLDTSQSDDAFVQSLQELRGIIDRGAERARERAGLSSAGTPTQSRPTRPVREGATATNPQTGERLVFRGGRWERL
jgi:hypothetical protein